MSFDIEFVRCERERALRGCLEASATFTFAISDGPLKARAEVMLTHGGIEAIKRTGKGAKAAARLALERLLEIGCDPFQTPIFLRVPYWQAELFSEYGNFDRVSGVS
jgi:hypothetical protein